MKDLTGQYMYVNHCPYAIRSLH